jgi:hypothetical protein
MREGRRGEGEGEEERTRSLLFGEEMSKRIEIARARKILEGEVSLHLLH